MDKKELKQDLFAPYLFIGPVVRILAKLGKQKVLFHQRKKEKMDLVMIQYLFLIKEKLHLHKCCLRKNLKLIIDQKLLKKLKNFFKLFIFHFIKIKNMINSIFINFKNTNFSFKFIFFIKYFFIYNKIILKNNVIYQTY